MAKRGEIIPAHPKWRIITEADDELIAVDHIIAWAIYMTSSGEGLRVTPITSLGMFTNAWGYLRPDGGVEECENGALFDSLEDAQRSARQRLSIDRLGSMNLKLSLIPHIDQARAKRVVLEALDQLATMGIHGTETLGRTYLPKLIVQYTLGDGLSRSDLARAMRELILEGVIRKEVVGKYANRQDRMGLVRTKAVTHE
jgi:hypothetical protein